MVRMALPPLFTFRNVISDPVRGFEFSCNMLNLPCEVTAGPQAAQAEEGGTVSTTVFRGTAPARVSGTPTGDGLRDMQAL